MKKLIVLTLSFFSVLSFSNGQTFTFELKETPQIKETQTSLPLSSSDDIIVDKNTEEIIIQPQPIPRVDKWMSLIQSKNRNYDLIEKALQSGQNPNQSIFEGNTILHLAAWQNDERLFLLGLKYGAQLSLVNKNGDTVLHWVAYSKNPHIIGTVFLNKNSLKLLDKQNKTGRSPLHFNALQWGNLEVAKFLIENKVNLDIKDINGQTPLHYAISLRKWDLVKLYIDSGADINIKDNFDNGFNEYIMNKGDTEAFKMFFKYMNPQNQVLIQSRLNH